MRKKGESDWKKVELVYLSEYCRVMKATIAIFAVAALLATTVLMTTATQQALADKVGPGGEDEDQLTQGRLGEFYSKEGKETYYGEEITGQEFGEERSDIAKSDSEVIGANSAYYASGECHSEREKEACQ